MNRGWKWLLVIIALLMMPMPVLIINANWWLIEPYIKMNWTPISWSNTFLAYYLLIASVLVLLLLLVFLLTVLFYPTRRKFNLINKKHGRLTVTAKAINNFVKDSLEKEPYLNNPKVSSRLTKRQIKIKIAGDFLASNNAQAKFDNYLHTLEDNLRNLLGIEQRPKIRIKLANYHPQEENTNRKLQ